MKILNWNVNGIRSVIGKGFSDFIRLRDPDVICLQEVKCNDQKIVDEIFLGLDYGVVTSFAEKKGYSGTLIAIKKEKYNQFIFKDLNQDLDISPINFTLSTEGRSVLAIHPKFKLLNLYMPSGSSSEERQQIKYEVMDSLYSNFKKAPDSFREDLIICGDFNICHQELDIHHPNEATKKELSGFLPNERKWFSDFLDLGFRDVYRELNPGMREYTWWSFRANSRIKNLGWRLDYFLAGKTAFNYIKSVKQHIDIKGSDHCPVEIELAYE